MEAACPHLGADMSLADIEEYCGEDGEEPSAVVVCPWHRQALPSSRPLHISVRASLNATAIGMILTWLPERAIPDFEHAFTMSVSETQSLVGSRRFGSKLRKRAPDGNW